MKPTKMMMEGNTAEDLLGGNGYIPGIIFFLLLNPPSAIDTSSSFFFIAATTHRREWRGLQDASKPPRVFICVLIYFYFFPVTFPAVHDPIRGPTGMNERTDNVEDESSEDGATRYANFSNLITFVPFSTSCYRLE
jgi:hypothetical protein